jgi:hypothetical protein
MACPSRIRVWREVQGDEKSYHLPKGRKVQEWIGRRCRYLCSSSFVAHVEGQESLSGYGPRFYLLSPTEFFKEGTYPLSFQIDVKALAA